MNNGLVHLYFGDGKGKTTAAIGIGVRASGRGKKILLVRFLKDNDSGEILALEGNSLFTILKDRPIKKFIPYMSKEEKTEAFSSQHELFMMATEELKKEQYGLVIFDELIDIINEGILPLEEIKDFLNTKPQNLEVVITGHNPHVELFALCDYVTEMRKTKHPYDKGITGRMGIEK